MGNKVSKKKPTKLLCIGLDNAGKSSIINKMKADRVPDAEVMPTVGYSVEQFKYGSSSITMFDMSGQGRYRCYWEHYYKDVGGIIFVIDSTDAERMCVVQDELNAVLAHPLIQNNAVPILFFANKSDMVNALDSAEVAQLLQLHRVTDRNVHMIRSNALSGEGLDHGMKWLMENLFRDKKRRV